MTEYWQSQARKYCDFCKCWLADNKVSISFHENGKRHKENRAKHISQLSKRSAKESKQRERMDDDIKKMEAAAMAAYLKDVESNADITSQTINAMLGGSSAPPPAAAPDPTPSRPEPVWHEVSCDGGSYFWNTQTNETVWEPPDEYLSIADLELKKTREAEAKKKKEAINKEKQKAAAEESRARAARERLRELAAPRPAPAPHAAPLGPAPRPALPYGMWTEVKHQETEKVDLQLPKSREKPPPVVLEPDTFKFKERKVPSLGPRDGGYEAGDGPVQFKKRKLCSGRRNARQKVDDD